MTTSTEERHRKLLAMKDEDIDYSDIPELDDAFWEEARVVVPPEKKRITIRLDRDVVDYFQSQGAGYQTRMNAVLKSYVEHVRGKGR